MWDYPGRGCKVQREGHFQPHVLAKLTGTLVFFDNASNSPQTVLLTGTGVLPATLTPANATYAAQAVGTSSAAKTFTLTNNQTVILTSIGISVSGDFAISGTTCTTSLAAKAKCTINVTFTPGQDVYSDQQPDRQSEQYRPGHDRRLCGLRDDLHKQSCGQGQMHDQCHVYARGDRNEDGKAERQRQRQQQPADLESVWRW